MSKTFQEKIFSYREVGNLVYKFLLGHFRSPARIMSSLLSLLVPSVLILQPFMTIGGKAGNIKVKSQLRKGTYAIKCLSSTMF